MARGHPDYLNVQQDISGGIAGVSAASSTSPVFITHGTVVADFSADQSSDQTQKSTHDFYVTGISVYTNTDPTTEVGTQHIPFKVLLFDKTADDELAFFLGGIPNKCSFILSTPSVIPAGNIFFSKLFLGGATNLFMLIVLHGYEIEI